VIDADLAELVLDDRDPLAVLFGQAASTDISIWLVGPVAETVSDGDGRFTVTFAVQGTPFTGIHDVIASGGAFSDRAQFTIER
jgi:hypothetical protein